MTSATANSRRGGVVGGLALKMGVKLEIFRMALYLTFPVTMFWISNQPEYFEEYIVKRKREIYPREQDDQKKQLQEMKETMRLKKEKLYMQD